MGAMDIISNIINYINLLVAVFIAGVQVYAFINCIPQKNEYFEKAGKQNHFLWLALTAVALGVGLWNVYLSVGAIGSGGVPGAAGGTLLAYAAAVVSGVYLAGVKPAITQVKNT